MQLIKEISYWMSEKTPWFSNWFDSEFYHILYSDRNHKEADLFVKKLVDYFQIAKYQSILDLGCGKGRHSFSLAQYSDAVMGVDLSKNSITFASSHSNGLNPFFDVADMRSFRLNKTFDFVFNLFTSFGYFDTLDENIQVLDCIASHQKSGGILLIDYLNSDLVRTNGESKMIKTIQGIDFHLHKYLTNDHVYKKINFEHDGKHFEFEERVQLFQKNDFEKIITDSGYEILNIYGNYSMDSYDESSDRMIIISRKK